jgi:Pentapeptide repeats (8 copies)
VGGVRLVGGMFCPVSRLVRALGHGLVGSAKERPSQSELPVPFGADLRGAGLSGADLSGADLRGADTLFITPKKLAQRAKSLEGATMPNGQKYEEWLKSRRKDR